MFPDVKLLVVTDDHALASDIRERIKHLFPQFIHISPQEVRREISRLQPDLVIVHESSGEATGMQLIPYIQNEVEKVEIIYFTESRDSTRIRDVSRAGAFDTLFFPDEITAIEDVLTRAVKSLESDDSENDGNKGFTWGRGQVIAFYSGKGGSGRSLLASTLAQTLQLDSSSSVLLVDLNLQYGGMETYLKVESTRNLTDLTPVLHELNDNHLRSVTVVEPFSQVELLASPADVDVSEMVMEEHVERVLRAARLYYDYIFVDLPTEITTLTYTALEEADRIYYVLNPDTVSMRMLNRSLSLFSTIGVDPAGRLEILLNRVNKDSEIDEKEVKTRFTYDIIGQFKDDQKKIEQAINRGNTLRTARNERNMTAFAKDVQKLAKRLLANPSRQSAIVGIETKN
ncbi:AAA family ATPase [Hazenella coriacea]|uniref:Pilus assembly protein CpaE n=1 Tax=Hazenella coriacea TaxID=1179467 RepID=A0A4R3L9V6_9BACL|nr:AAA family ATPase [Hazenella coriacea]TCS94266.1 pilus assembly protein CpaE [Hazenella coriacea]